MRLAKKIIWCILISLSISMSSCRHHRRRVGVENIQNAHQQDISQVSTGRSKREGFVDLNAIPNMMRGFAHNFGRGFNNMVQHSQNLGHRVVHNVMHNMPTIMYGNWKPITTSNGEYNSEPAYKPVEAAYKPVEPSYTAYKPVEPSYTAYKPVEPSYKPSKPATSPSNYLPPSNSYAPLPPVSVEPIVQFNPIIEPAKPIYTVKPAEPIFVKPEPVYVKPSPTPGPIYLKPVVQPNEDSYGKPLGQPIVPSVSTTTVLQPFEETFTIHPAVPETHETGFLINPPGSGFPSSTLVTNNPLLSNSNDVVISNIPEEYSQNPDHVNHIAGDTLYYKDLSKLHSKPKSVEGDLANYRPKPGTVFFVSNR